jgi:hypothetical protein
VPDNESVVEINIPDTEAALAALLKWLGFPAVIIALYLSFLHLLGWLEFWKKSVRNVSTAQNRARQTFRAWTTARQRAAAGLVVASAAFVAMAYSVAQLFGVTYQKLGGHRSIAEGLSFDAGYLFGQLVGYQHWTRTSAWAVIAALGSIFVLTFANLAGSKGLHHLVAWPWNLVLGLGMIAGGLLAIDGLCVLVLGLTHSDNYQPSMAWLYGLWVFCLFALPWLGQRIVDDSRRLFAID